MIFGKRRPGTFGSSGFTLIETVVSIGVIGLAVFAAASLLVYMSSEKRKLREKSFMQRSIRAFSHQISASESNLPAFPAPSRWGQSNYDPYTDPNLADEICYTSDGTALPNKKDPNCFFKIQYFRIVVPDQKYPAGQDISYLPLSRLYFRVNFRTQEGDQVYYFSRLQTSYLQQ